MNMQLVQAPLHTEEQVREIIETAALIADDNSPLDGKWEAVFAQACTLLAARATAFVAPQPVDLGALRLPNGSR